MKVVVITSIFLIISTLIFTKCQRIEPPIIDLLPPNFASIDHVRVHSPEIIPLEDELPQTKYYFDLPVPHHKPDCHQDHPNNYLFDKRIVQPNIPEATMPETTTYKETTTYRPGSSTLRSEESSTVNGSQGPPNYSFEYHVNDAPSGNDFGHKESREGDVVKGRYYVLLPNGFRQVVDYIADRTGYHPKISYVKVD